MVPSHVFRVLPNPIEFPTEGADPAGHGHMRWMVFRHTLRLFRRRDVLSRAIQEHARCYATAHGARADLRRRRRRKLRLRHTGHVRLRFNEGIVPRPGHTRASRPALPLLSTASRVRGDAARRIRLAGHRRRVAHFAHVERRSQLSQQRHARTLVLWLRRVQAHQPRFVPGELRGRGDLFLRRDIVQTVLG